MLKKIDQRQSKERRSCDRLFILVIMNDKGRYHSLNRGTPMDQSKKVADAVRMTKVDTQKIEVREKVRRDVLMLKAKAKIGASKVKGELLRGIKAAMDNAGRERMGTKRAGDEAILKAKRSLLK